MKLNDKVDHLLAEAEELLRERGDVRRERAEWLSRMDQVGEHFDDLADKAVALMSDEDRARVEQAFEQTKMRDEYSGRLAGPYAEWINDLIDGRSRLPDDLSVETMKELLLAWLHPLAEQCGYAPVCTACGLEYPHTKQLLLSETWQPPMGQGRPWNPKLFASCPHCGSPAGGDGMMWSHRIHEKHYPWVDLDGYVGKPPRDFPEAED